MEGGENWREEMKKYENYLGSQNNKTWRPSLRKQIVQQYFSMNYITKVTLGVTIRGDFLHTPAAARKKSELALQSLSVRGAWEMFPPVPCTPYQKKEQDRN